MNFTTTIILAVLIGIIYPIYIIITHQKVNRNIKQNEKYRLIDYKQTLLIFWGLTILILVNYFAYKQPALNFYPKFSLINFGLTILVLAFAYFQYSTTKISTDISHSVKEKLKDIYHYLPKNRQGIKLVYFSFR